MSLHLIAVCNLSNLDDMTSQEAQNGSVRCTPSPDYNAEITVGAGCRGSLLVDHLHFAKPVSTSC